MIFRVEQEDVMNKQILSSSPDAVSAADTAMREDVLMGIIEVPRREVDFVERAYRATLGWLVGVGAVFLAAIVGSGLLA
jgi:hypothetical protein